MPRLVVRNGGWYNQGASMAACPEPVCIYVTARGLQQGGGTDRGAHDCMSPTPVCICHGLWFATGGGTIGRPSLRAPSAGVYIPRLVVCSGS